MDKEFLTDEMRFEYIKSNKTIESIIKDLEDKKIPLKDIFIDGINQNYYFLVKYALDKGLDPSIENNKYVKLASYTANEKIIELLVKDPKVNISIDNNEILRHAILYGQINLVKILMKDPRLNLTKWTPEIFNNSFVNIHENETDEIRNKIKILKMLFQDARIRANLDDDQVERYKKIIDKYNK